MGSELRADVPSRVISVKAKLFLLTLMSQGITPALINRCIEEVERSVDDPEGFKPTLWDKRFNYVYEELAADFVFRL